MTDATYTDIPEDPDDDLQAWLDSHLDNSARIEHKLGDAHSHLLPASAEEDPSTAIGSLGQRLSTQATNDDSNADASICGLPDALQSANYADEIQPFSTNIQPLRKQETWSPDYAGVELLTISPTIIKLKNSTFVELRCDVCHGNSSWAHHKFNRGVRGFQSHFRQVHNEKPSVEAVLQRCTYRVVSAHEVEQIISGDSQIDFIPCKQKVSVGSGVEYVGNTSTIGPITPRRIGHTVESLAAATQTKITAPVAPKKRKTAKPNSGPASATPKTRTRIRDTSAPCLANCLVVVKTTAIDGTDKYHELRCDVCGGNGSYGSGRLLEGIKGFKAHFRQIHHEHLLTADVLRRCSHREVPMQEVQQIQGGNVNIGFIRCQGSPTVRPKKSYKDFDNAERT
jgi:hypothetical protein